MKPSNRQALLQRCGQLSPRAPASSYATEETWAKTDEKKFFFGTRKYIEVDMYRKKLKIYICKTLTGLSPYFSILSILKTLNQ